MTEGFERVGKAIEQMGRSVDPVGRALGRSSASTAARTEGLMRALVEREQAPASSLAALLRIEKLLVELLAEIKETGEAARRAARGEP